MDNEEVIPRDDRQFSPRLVGLSGALGGNLDSSSVASRNDLHGVKKEDPGSTDFFKGLQWSLDGTTILLSTTSNRLATYILPPDLLDAPSSQSHHDFRPYTIHELPESSYATAIHPYYNLSSPETCLYLASPRNLPIRLLSPFAPGILASYPLVNPTTEAWIAPHSLLFSPRDANTFYAGADGLISEFNLQRNGEGPVGKIHIGAGRKRKTGATALLARNGMTGGERKMRGIISAMAMNTEGILAIGTFTGHLALLDPSSPSPQISALSPTKDADNGITSVHFHPSPSHNNYLLAASRLSTTIQIYDIRNSASPLSVLTGRQAMTQQRLGVDITERGNVLAGGTDGKVHVWEGIGMQEGEIEPSRDWQAHGDVVGGVGAHPGGAGVVASCSGSRRYDYADLTTSNLRRDYQRQEGGTVWEDSEGSASDSTSSGATSPDPAASTTPITKSTPDRSFKVWAL